MKPIRLPSAQRGFSLIELMVSLTIGLILLTVMLMIFADSSNRGQDMSRANMQIENGRYASELLSEELSLAGFWGSLHPPVVNQATGEGFSDPDPCSTAPNGWKVSAPYTIPAAVRGVAANEALGCLSHRKAGTAAIVIRRVSIDTVDVAAAVANQYYLQESFCNDDPVATPFVFSKVKGDFILRVRECAAKPLLLSPLRSYVSRIYFVADCNKCGSSDGVPTLKRVELQGNSLVETALVEGVEDLRFEYGFDTEKDLGGVADGNVNQYLAGLSGAQATSTWGNVVSVKVHFVTRSLEKANGMKVENTAQTFNLGSAVVNFAADGYLRRAYSQTVRLTNPSAARELQ